MDFRRDDRGVSGVIGAVLLLGFLIALLAMYQASYIPNQNEQIEFGHSQDVQNDMIQVRNGLLSADSLGETTYRSVKLGTRYPVRLLGINPPPASGTLRTGPPETVSVTDGGGDPVSNLCPGSGDIQTRTLEYDPGYNVYGNAPTIVYENTVLYLDFGDRTVLLTDQQFVQGDTVSIHPLNSSFYEVGVERVPVEGVPGNVNDEEVQNAAVTVPTGLGEDTWERLLADEVDPADVTVADGELTVETSGDVAVSCAPVGLNEAPAGGERQTGGIEINPAGPNDVFLQSITKDTTGGDNTVTVTLNNTANRDTNITQARMSFYFNPNDQPNKDIDPYDITKTGTVHGENFRIGDSMTSLDPDILLPGNETETTVSFEFNTENVAGEDFFVVELRFETGEKGTYFVDIPN